jgi:acetyl-CoA carboxylase biotin carboxyl carrier protein
MSESNTLDDDLAAIRALAEVLEDTGLAEIEIERGALRLRISKSSSLITAAAPQHLPAAAPASAPLPPAKEESAANHPGAVTAPMVGTAYLASSPGAAPFVQAGSEVKEGQTLLIIEAMKTMNEIKSPRSGKVTTIHARDAEPVEFGETLMIIE